MFKIDISNMTPTTHLQGARGIPSVTIPNILSEEQKEDIRTFINLLDKPDYNLNPYECFPNPEQKLITFEEFGNTYYLGSVPPFMFKKVNNLWEFVGEALFENYNDDLLLDEEYNGDEEKYYNMLKENREQLIISRIYYNKNTEELKRTIDNHYLSRTDSEIKSLTTSTIYKCFENPINDLLIDRIISLKGIEIFEANTNKILIDKIRSLREKQIFENRNIQYNQMLVDIIIERYGLPNWWTTPAIKDVRRNTIEKTQLELKERWNIYMPYHIQEKLYLLSTPKAKTLLRNFLLPYTFDSQYKFNIKSNIETNETIETIETNETNETNQTNETNGFIERLFNLFR